MRNILLFSLLALVSCGEKLDTVTVPGKGTYSAITVKWSDNVNADCKNVNVPMDLVLEGCATVSNNVCSIVVPKPSSFDDSTKLELLGHEMLHCLGWMHVKPT